MLKSYLLRHIKVILLALCMIGVFAVVFSLYDLPLEPILYASLLCLVFGVLLFALGYAQYCARHRLLQEVRHQVTVSLDALPSPRSVVEEDYQDMLHALWDDRARVQSECDSAQENERAYYLSWTHQIKVPLSALRLLLREDDERNASALAELTKIGQYADMALQYQRLSAGNDLVLRPCPLDEIVRGVLRKTARLFILKHLSVDFRETGMTVLTDEKWLDVALSQILSNALKYTPSGTIRIYGGEQTLVIADPGIGIRPEDLPRVCECGFTGYNGRADKKSTGIGLYLCRRALTLCGHGLRIESRPEVGTTVFLDLSTHRGMLE